MMEGEGGPIRIVVADDAFLARAAVAELIDETDGLELAAVCEDRYDLDEAMERERPQVVVTDVRMPPLLGDEGIAFAADLRRSDPEVGVVVLSQYLEARYALKLFDGGSARRAYLLKEYVQDRGQLVEAVRAVARGDSVVDPHVVEALIGDRRQRERTHVDELTERELEVLAQIAAGASNAAIAGRLFLTKRAVEKHINAIFFKLELPESPDISRRVTASLLFLAEERDGDSPFADSR